jgi:predicted metal-binding protein
MDGLARVGFIVCHRYHTCADGKCLMALRNCEGAFRTYKDQNVGLVGYAVCGGYPGGNLGYPPSEMQRNGAQVIHFATGLVVGYPPCRISVISRISTKQGTEWVWPWGLIPSRRVASRLT